jgi:anti-sigma factor RsiW
MTDDVRNRIAVFADGELAAPEREALERELAQSGELRDELARWRALRDCASRTLNVRCPDGLRERVSHLLVEGRPQPLLAFRWRVSSLAASIAIFLVLSSIAPPAGQRGDNTAVASTLVRPELFTNVFLACAKKSAHNAMALSSACPVSAQDRMRKEFAYTVLVPDLRPKGYRLEGICRCARVGDACTVHAHFRRISDNVPVSVFSVSRCVRLQSCCGSPEACGVTRTYQQAHVDGVTVLKWDDCSGSFAFVAELDSPSLRAIADDVRVAFLEALVGGPAVAAR